MKTSLLVLFFAATHAFTAVVEVGNPMITYSLPDQHGEMHHYTTDKRIIIISYEKKTGKLVNNWLKEEAASYLADHRTDFIVEIYKMPKIISNRIAIPKMRKYPHLVLISKNPNLHETYPKQKNKLTVIQIDEKGIVSNIHFIEDIEKLKALVEAIT